MTTDRTEIDPLGVWPDAAPPQGAPTAVATRSPALPVRVAEPMAVLWQGMEYAVAEWDVSGLTLRAPMPAAVAPGRGRVVDLLLLIGQGDTRLSMQVQARALPGDESSCGYQFLNLGRAQSELLHRIVTTAISRQELSLTELLNDTQDTRQARKATIAQAQDTRSWFQMGLAGLVIAGAGTALFNNMTTVKARYAAVTAVAAQVSVPASGMVTQIAVQPGAEVRAGDVLALIRPADFDAQRESAATRLRALEAEQAELRERARALDAARGTDTALVDTERAGLARVLRLAEDRLGLERAQLATLMATGLPTPERQAARARQQALTLSAEQDVLSARTALARLDASAGSFGDPRAALTLNTLSPEALALRLQHLSDEITRAYALAEGSAHGLPVIAPCDCRVVAVHRGVGEWADPQRPVFVLAKGAASSIHALVLAEEARGLREGTPATIRLADGTRMTGSVARLGYDAQWPGFAGLSDSIFAAERYARVEIRPDGGIAAPVGMTAQVDLRAVDIVGSALALLGFQSRAPQGTWQ
ncbi:MAG: HlyD family secretion protein [Roseinatronobacter sp.]